MIKTDETAGESVDAIVKKLTAILVNELQVTVPAERIHEQASLEDELGIDSVAMLELIAAVEGAFGFEFLDSDLRTSTFQNLRALAEVIANRLRPAATPQAV